MRHLLVDCARKHHCIKRGGEAAHIEFGEVQEPAAAHDLESILELHLALQQLAAVDERKSRVVEMRFFGGLSVEEVAEVLGVALTRSSGIGGSLAHG